MVWINLYGTLEVVYRPLMVIDDMLPEMIPPEEVGFVSSWIDGAARSHPGSFLRSNLNSDFVRNGARHFALQLQDIGHGTLVLAGP
jgi:hypothetical protein